MKKNICILGSTGSIGTQTLCVISQNPDLKAVSLVGGKNAALIEEQARRFHPRVVAMANYEAYLDVKTRLADTDIMVYHGPEGIRTAIDEANTVVSAIVGLAGLWPTVYAIEQGKTIALANKETMVAAGSIVTKLAREKEVTIYPVDSEHSAIFQSLQGMQDKKEVARLILTASGGPFLEKTRQELENVTPAMALNHPNWSMGNRVTIDSATLANKGLEVMEAMWLFNRPLSQIKVVVHPQSIVHSMVEYVDGAVIAQLGIPDMKIPIAYALTYPNRMPLSGDRLNFTKTPLTFFEPDEKTFSALSLAYEAARAGGVVPCVFNSADEEAVSLFLQGRISFLQITDRIEKAVLAAPQVKDPSLDDIREADRWARQYVSHLG